MSRTHSHTSNRFKLSQVILIILLIAATWYVNAWDMVSVVPKNDNVNYFSESLAGPFIVHGIEADLTQGGIGLMAWRSGGLVTTTRQVRDASTAGYKVIGGLNADFFNFQSTLPIGNHVTEGEFVYGIHSRRSHVLVDNSGNVLYEPVSFEGRVKRGDDLRVRLTGVNRHRANDQAMFYNRYYEGLSRNDSSGVELAVRLLPGYEWRAGNEVRMVVDSIKQGYMFNMNGRTMISVGSSHSDYPSYRQLKTADTLSVFLGFRNAELKNIMQVVGGGGRILRDGKDATGENIEMEGIAESFLTTRHPRSVVASNRDGSKVWLLAIDGRQSTSVGMNFEEMAAYLQSLGAWNAVNLDGGGSTTLVYDNRVVNSPSDPTGERAVANIIMLVGR